MRLQLADPLDNDLHVTVQLAEGLSDRPGLFAHPCVLQNRAHCVECRHRRCRGYDPYPRREAFAHNLREIRVQLGIDRFGRQEHQRPIRRLAVQNILLGNRLDMDPNRLAQRRRRPIKRLLRFCRAQGLVGLQRELGINRDRPGRVRQVDQTIRAFTVRKRRLQRVTVARQSLGHDIRQLDFPERPPRLLVGQYVLKAQHIARQLGDIFLRAVDGRKPLLQFGQGFRRLLRSTSKRLVHTLLHVRQRTRGFQRVLMQPLLHLLLHRRQSHFHRLDHLALCRGLRVRHRPQSPGQLFLPRLQRLNRTAKLAHLKDHWISRPAHSAQ